MILQVLTQSIRPPKLTWQWKVAFYSRKYIFTTLPETNMAPEDRPSQKESSIPTFHFQVRKPLVSGSVMVHLPAMLVDPGV